MSRDFQAFDETSVVIERKGYGAKAWKWRVSNGVIDLATSLRSFVCAEDAYADGRARMLQIRSDAARVVRRPTERLFDEDLESFSLTADA